HAFTVVLPGRTPVITSVAGGWARTRAIFVFATLARASCLMLTLVLRFCPTTRPWAFAMEGIRKRKSASSMLALSARLGPDAPAECRGGFGLTERESVCRGPNFGKGKPFKSLRGPVDPTTL